MSPPTCWLQALSEYRRNIAVVGWLLAPGVIFRIVTLSLTFALWCVLASGVVGTNLFVIVQDVVELTTTLMLSKGFGLVVAGSGNVSLRAQAMLMNCHCGPK